MPKTKANKLTPAHRRVLNSIRKFIADHGYSPTIREIAKEANLKSYSTALYHMEWLKTHGYISYEPRSPRTIRIKDK